MLADKISNFSNNITIATCSMSAFRPLTKSYDSLSLNFTNGNTINFKKKYVFGEDYNDRNGVSKLKETLEQISGSSLFTIDYFLHIEPKLNIFTDVKVKLVMIENEPFAFGNMEETKFLLLNVNPIQDQQILSKEELENELNELLTYRANSIIEEFSNDVSKLNTFLLCCKPYLSNISIQDFEKIQSLVSQLKNLLNKSDS